MCEVGGRMLQAGMNFRPNGRTSIFLMSVRPGAPYEDRTQEDGRVLIYEGHDVARRRGGPDPKAVDQPMRHRGGGLTMNGKFYEAALAHKHFRAPVELVKVFEKIRSGVWVYNGTFRLVDAWQEPGGSRSVFKFRLEIHEGPEPAERKGHRELPHDRVIPTDVKLEVWKRDKGRCVKCGNKRNLHFDHILPYSKGGTSLKAVNIQLLCAKHNLAKHDRIE
jgi:hypothetical protein